MRETIEAIDDQVFIVRCWNDTPAHPVQRPLWRIRVSYLTTDDDHYFSNTQEVARFIDDSLAAVYARKTNSRPN